MIEVLKRDKKTKECFQEHKIRHAIESAYLSVGKNIDEDVFECVLERLGVREISDENTLINVEDIQDGIEKCLFDYDVEVAISFHDYRLTHKLIRNEKKGLAREFAKKLMCENIENQNANVDEYSFGGRMAEASNVYKKDFALNNCVSKQTKRNHLNNESYIHDLDNYASGEHNCLTEPLDDLLANGSKVGQTDIRPAGSINSAMQLTAVYFQIQSQEQFGGVAASHYDWTMVPYVRKSFFKHYVLNYIKEQEDFDSLSVLSMTNDEIDDWVDSHKEEFLKKFNLTKDDFRLDNIKKLDKHYANAALFDTKIELMQAVEALYHNLNTLQSRPGSQLPFSSMNYGSCTLPEGQIVIEALLDGSLRGTGKYHLTPIFPCGIFQVGKGINKKPGDPNYYLFRKALQSTAKRIYPNYANLDWSGNKGYDKNDPKTYFSTMGCHARGTKIVMADGTRKNVEDILVGDKLAGVNNGVRTVEKLIHGVGKMYKVEQSRGETYVVNDGHILALEYSSNKKYKGYKKGDKVNMTINELLSIPESTRRFFKGYKSSYELEEKEYDIPPYILGLWLGDGNSTSTRFSVNINETQIIEDLAKYAESIGKKLTIREDSENCLSVDIACSDNKNEGNYFRKALINYNLISNKHIPECYFYGSKEQRSALLAGLINTDGWAKIGRGRQSVCFGNTNLNLIHGVQRLANSLGFVTTVIKARGEAIGTGICEGSVLKPYYHVNIHRYDNELLMEHKRTNINLNATRNFSTSTLKITELPEDEFFGFELDGDRLYLLDDCTVTHNCRTANGWDINGLGQLKDGRGNICPQTIIMPTLAMQVLEENEVEDLRNGIISGDKEKKLDKFMRLLSRKIDQTKDSLIERFDWIASQNPKSAPFMWTNGTMAGYVPEEGIRSALKHGTLAIGQLGLAETLQILIGKNHTTEEGMEVAKRIERLFRKKCADFKEEYKLNFGVYFTPAENLCYTAMKKFKDKYGIIPNVSDRAYFTNSIHVPVWEAMTPFQKIDIESQLTGFSSAGCITYVEVDSKVINNIDALEEMVIYAMDKDIPYFAVNFPIDNCEECGYSGEIIGDKCPVCGSTKVEHLGRVTGYLSSDVRRFNYGKQSEFKDRVDHEEHILV